MGDAFINTTLPTKADAAAVYAQAFTHGNDHQVLLINKRNAAMTVQLDGMAAARVVDSATNQGPPRDETGLQGSIVLAPFATAVATVTT